jgi:hypothetical protein
MVHAIECKGGTSPLEYSYGHFQGTSEWAVEAAKFVLRSKAATAAEKAAAQVVLKAAAQGRLVVHVIRTSHVLGEPIAAVLEQTVSCSSAAQKMALSALDDLAKAIAEVAPKAITEALPKAISEGAAVTMKTVARNAPVIGVAIDGGLRVKDSMETERKFAFGEISQQERVVSHVENAAGMAGGWAGAGGGAWAAGAAAAPLAAMTGPGAPFVEGGAIFVGAVAGYVGGDKAASTAARWTANQIHDTGTAVSGAAQQAWSWATNW